MSTFKIIFLAFSRILQKQAFKGNLKQKKLVFKNQLLKIIKCDGVNGRGDRT